MFLKNEKNDFDNDYKEMKLRELDTVKQKLILKYLNNRIGMEKSLSRDFTYEAKIVDEVTFVRAGCYYLEKFKSYSIILWRNHLIGGFDNGLVYLIDKQNVFAINNSNLEHYYIFPDSMRLVNSFPIDSKSICIRAFKGGAIINGRIYNIKFGTFTTPEYDEIYSDCDSKDSIIFDENICPKELRFALQKIVKQSGHSLGIKQVVADEPLIDLEKEEHIATISISVIDKSNNSATEYFYYDPLINKIVTEKMLKPDDISTKVKDRLNSITDIINCKRVNELENSLYVDAIESISTALPETAKQKVLETNNIIKKYKKINN